MPKIGAHVSSAVSLDLSFQRAMNIGADCTQIFVSPPQQWSQIPHHDSEIEAYKKKASEYGIGPNFIHAIYLINLATNNQENLKKAVDWLVYSLNVADQLGIEGTITHIGSCKDRGETECLEQVIESIKEILQQTKNSFLILENCAGAGNLIGDRLSEIGDIIKEVNDPRVKVCLDTQHLFASGYNLKTTEDLNNLIQEIEEEIGWDKVIAIHLNDSKTELGSKKDRHENIGEGLIGKEAFRTIVNHPRFQNIPFLLEVPGFSDNGPDEENIQILKSLIEKNQ